MRLLIQWAVTSSALILIVLAVRFLFRNRLSARLRYALWGVVLLRLLVPFQIALPAGANDALPVLASNLAPELPTVLDRPLSPETAHGYTLMFPDTAERNGYQIQEDGTVIGAQPDQLILLDRETGNVHNYVGSPTLGDVPVFLWNTGAVFTALAILGANLRFAQGLGKRRRPLEEADTPIPVYTTEGLLSPCLFGVLHPAVYVTPGAAEDETVLRHVLAHELTHYRHRDHIWSALRVLALALHWYNPLVWLAVWLSKKDGELACDEGAVARLGDGERISYGRTLVDMVAARSLRPGDLLSCSTAMTGGRKSIQQRVAALVKKPETVKTALFAVIAVAALAVVFTFAGRGDADSDVSRMYDQFLRNVEQAESVQYTPSVHLSSQFYPSAITDEDLISQAKAHLSTFTPLGEGETGPDWNDWDSISRSGTILLSSDGYQTEWTILYKNSYNYLIPGNLWRSYRELREAEGDDAQIVDIGPVFRSEYGVRTGDILGVLSGQQGDRDVEVITPINTPKLEEFFTQLEVSSSIRIEPSPVSDTAYPYPITDSDLLEQARERLTSFILPEAHDSLPDPKKLTSSSKIILSDGTAEAVYSLVLWNDYTWLIPGDAFQAYASLEEGQEIEYGAIFRTWTKTNVPASLNGLAAQQFARQDEAHAASVFNGNSYHSFLSHAKTIYRGMPTSSQEKALSDLALLVWARELLTLERIPQDEPVAWDGEGWTWSLTFSFQFPGQERIENTEQCYYVVPKDGDRSYLCSEASQAGSIYLGTVANKALEELDQLFQDQEELDSHLRQALETCDSIHFENSADPDITDPAALEQAKSIFTSGLLIDDLNHTGQNGDNEKITIRYNGGLGSSTFLVTNRSIREDLHTLARNQ